MVKVLIFGLYAKYCTGREIHQPEPLLKHGDALFSSCSGDEDILKKLQSGLGYKNYPKILISNRALFNITTKPAKTIILALLKSGLYGGGKAT